MFHFMKIQYSGTILLRTFKIKAHEYHTVVVIIKKSFIFLSKEMVDKHLNQIHLILLENKAQQCLVFLHHKIYFCKSIFLFCLPKVQIQLILLRYLTPKPRSWTIKATVSDKGHTPYSFNDAITLSLKDPQSQLPSPVQKTDQWKNFLMAGSLEKRYFNHHKFNRNIDFLWSLCQGQKYGLSFKSSSLLVNNQRGRGTRIFNLYPFCTEAIFFFEHSCT